MQQQEILKKILKKKVDRAEVFLSSTRALKIAVLDQKIESIDEIIDKGLGIRVIKNKKLGFAFTSEFDDSIIENTIERAIANAKNTEADEFHALPNKLVAQPTSASTKLSTSSAGLFDSKIDKTSIKEKTDLALAVEASAYKASKKVKKTERVSYSDSASEIWIVNSNGLDINYKSNHCGASAQVIAQDGGMEAGFGMDYVKKFKDLDPAKIGQEAAKRASQLLDAKTIKSQKLPLILDPEVGTELLEVLLSPLTAEAVQKGKSLFINNLIELVPIFRKKLNVK